MSASRILVVEDDLVSSKLLTYKLSARGYQVHEASSAREASEVTLIANPHLVILDLGLPVAGPMAGQHNGGIRYLEWLNKNVTSNKPAVVVVSAWSPLNAEPLTRRLGAVAYLQKPAEDSRLFAAIDKALLDKALEELPVAACAGLGHLSHTN